jgi:hypothetical protein
MNNKQFSILIATIILVAVLLAHAQSYSTLGGGPIAPAVANCTVSATGYWAFCPVGSGTIYSMYVSYNGGAYQLLVPATSAGVATFNGRSGAVILTDADVTGTGLKVVTTVTSTAVSTPQ